MAAVTYRITNMRVVRNTGKIAEKHPERIFSVYGTFFKGDDPNPLSISSKYLTNNDISRPEFHLDVKKGILVLFENPKGRHSASGMTQEEIEAELAAIAQ